MLTIPTTIIQSQLSNKQYLILELLYRFRFLTAYHLQHFFKHTYQTTVQGWLTNLQRLGYVHQFYDRHSVFENTKPAVYCLTARSRELLKDNTALDNRALKNLYREKNYSTQFRDHWCYITDLYFILQNLYANTTEEIHISTNRDLHEYAFFPHPIPDIYFAVTAKRKKTKRYFLELFDEKTKRSVIRSRVKRYITCSENAWKQQTDEMFPFILLIAANKQQYDYLRRHIRRTLRQEFSELPFFLATKENLLQHGFTNDTWEEVTL